MWFKNLQVYRLPANWDMSAERLEEQLAKKPFHPCGSQDMESRGWLSPLGNEVLVHAVGGQWLVCLGFEHRLLPSAVVKQEADERAEELAEQQGYKLGRKQLKELREQVTQELMPRAFTRRRRMFAWIDPINGWLVVDAASQSKAEDMLEQLRHTLDSFPLTCCAPSCRRPVGDGRLAGRWRGPRRLHHRPGLRAALGGRGQGRGALCASSARR
jgi:recombination associated protein RdgC